jgi:hypothetical protein
MDDRTSAGVPLHCAGRGILPSLIGLRGSVFARAPDGLLPVLARVVGILLTAIAVDLILDGLRDFF